MEFVSGDLSLQSEEISEYLDGMGGNTERIKDQLTVYINTRQPVTSPAVL